jgi:hypothetical protein
MNMRRGNSQKPNAHERVAACLKQASQKSQSEDNQIATVTYRKWELARNASLFCPWEQATSKWQSSGKGSLPVQSMMVA